MPLLFNDRRVLRLQDVHTPDHPLQLDGTYFYRLRQEPVQLAFKWQHLVAGVTGASSNVAVHTGPPTVTRRTGRGDSRHPFREEAQTLVDAPDGFKLLPSCAVPTVDTIRWGTEDVYKVWYLRGSIELRSSDQPTGGETSAWRHTKDLLTGHRQEGLAQITGLGHGRCKARAMDSDAVGERYFGVVEFVGTVTPHDAPGVFPFFRWKRTQRIANNAGGEPLVSQPHRDSSPDAVQRHDKTAAGQVFDFDAPGAIVPEGFPADFEETHTAKFTQFLVVGDLEGTTRLEPTDPRVLRAMDWKYAAKWKMHAGGGDQLIEKADFDAEWLGEETD